MAGVAFTLAFVLAFTAGPLDDVALDFALGVAGKDMAMDFGGWGGAGAAPGAGCGLLAGGSVANAPSAAAKAHSCVGLRNHVKHISIPWAS